MATTAPRLPARPALHYGPRKHVSKRREQLEALRFDAIETKLLSPCLGAEIRGVELSKPLAPDVLKEIETALIEYKVIFFRDQDIEAADHARFARNFGELEIHPFLPVGETPEIIRFSKDETTVGAENVWHSDVTWREEPSLGSILRAHEVPEVGGDTIWCDTEAVYEGLDEELQAEIEGRFAIHDFVHTFGLALSEEERAEKRKQFPPARHPIVRTHPVTGRKCLYVNSVFTSHVEGMEPADSDALLGRLFAAVQIPEYQVRFKWEANSIAFWDNRSTQHLAVSDYWPERRIMERLTIIGDRPH